MALRQQQRPRCARTQPTTRLSVQRGFGSAPVSGGRGDLLLSRAERVTDGSLNLWAKGAATGALIQQRLRAVFNVAVQAPHHRLGVTARAFGHLGATCTLRDIMQGEETLATARMPRTDSHLTKIGLVLASALMINAYISSDEAFGKIPI